MGQAEKLDVYNVMKCYGQTIRLINGAESDVERDEYGSIIDTSTSYKTLYSFPIEFSPSQKQMEKSGIIEKVDVLFWVSKYECDARSITYATIDTIRQIINYGGNNYKIKAKNQVSLFGSDFLYIVLGGIKN